MDRRQFLKLAGGTALGPAVSRFAGNGAGSVLASGPAALAHQSTARPNYGPNPAPGTGPAPVTRKLLVLTLNPAFAQSVVESEWTGILGWNDPDWLVSQSHPGPAPCQFRLRKLREIVENVHLRQLR